MMGGALGLAILASLAAHRTNSLRVSGEGPLAALTGGYHVAFLVGAFFAVAAASVGTAFFRSSPALGHAHAPDAEAVSQTNT
jgi:hypothetical protein